MKNLLKLFLVLTLVFGLSSMASGYHATFFGEDPNPAANLYLHPNADSARAQFFSNLVGVGTETFEGFSVGQSAPLAVDFGSAGTATLTGSVSVYQGTNSVGRYPISGQRYLETTSENFILTFNQPIAAFGFYGTDLGDFNGRVTVTTVGGISIVYEIPHSLGGGNNDGKTVYWGVIDTVNPFVQIVFGNSAAGTDYFGFDDFSIGSMQQVKPTPEPTTMLLLGLGVLGLAGLRKRD